MKTWYELMDLEVVRDFLIYGHKQKLSSNPPNINTHFEVDGIKYGVALYPVARAVFFHGPDFKDIPGPVTPYLPAWHADTIAQRGTI